MPDWAKLTSSKVSTIIFIPPTLAPTSGLV